ncbi:NfeD family protein [methanotrophic endosymbiont of Bathymodiolus puteoserpentis (Logatchev)]|uniref:NfeD family protein n=1 Tax=methanotrophic endosymbiont of Bathymodiolus puteoserpentis (Logatchev) TaxID=343235 RepID=UPI0013CD75FC|nr:nodulation protein NfeD [methanotrophic endosymbiont of Bathymodiolus puteoserpentis (Logatchev)]SHE20615.1 Putative membrane-bound ClpP-class protease associated with aq_911 [methanotrophic endosymbiont of Bathymodiolus puteoserpentis (Logatchev)]
MFIVQSMRFIFLVLLTVISAAYAEDKVKPPNPSLVIQLEINGIISPATADYIVRNLKKAIDQQAMAVLILIDTPGGLDISMRQIIQQIIAAPIPVISYVSPSGARAASAGTYILYASHIAAMAPATNLGAATPVQMGGFGKLGNDKTKDKQNKPVSDPMTHKMVNDASAYIRGLAKMHGRNAQWAEQAVRNASSLSATEALKLNVIDLVATDVNNLFQQLQGRKINVSGKELILNTENIELQRIKPDWRSQFLAVITNPSMAYILLMIGIYGLVLEFSHPGSVVPGTVGGICFLLALYALQLLPVNYAGMGLILFGVTLMIVEAFMPTFGILGLGGVIAFVIGSVILMDTDMPGFGIDLGLIAGFALSSAVFFIIALGLILKARHNPVVSGKEQMLDSIGVVLDDFTGKGMIHIHGENWQAICDQPLHKNEKVIVTAIEGLLLQVIPH